VPFILAGASGWVGTAVGFHLGGWTGLIVGIVAGVHAFVGFVVVLLAIWYACARFFEKPPS
jgi:hypothetical protein